MAWASLILVLGALALAGARVASPLVLGGWSWWTRRTRPAAAVARSRWIPVVLLLPVVFGCLLAASAVGAVRLEDGLIWSCHCGSSPGLHLCVRHPELSAPLVPYALLVWLVFGPPPLRALAAFGGAIWRGRGMFGRLRDLTADTVETDVRLAPLGTPDALTVGLLRPVIVADRDWWAALEPAERAIAAAHERAHVERRDVLTHLVVRALAAWQPARLAVPLVADWLDRAEQCADAHAAAAAGDPLGVAEFLVRQRRIGAARAAVGLRGGRFDRRIAALLEPRAQAAHLASDLDATFACGLALLALAWPLGPALHAAAEALLRHLH